MCVCVCVCVKSFICAFSFGPSSAKIAKAVAQMAKSFPTVCRGSTTYYSLLTPWIPYQHCSQAIQASLREVGLSSQRLQRVCQDSSVPDPAGRTRLIVNSSFDVAKAARHLVMCVQQEQ